MFSVALLLLAAGSSVKCEQLTQPSSETIQPGQRLTITCQVSYSVGSYHTAWIRQPAGKGLEWIGMRYTGATYFKDSLKNKFSIDLDSSSNRVTLNGQNMQPEDSAVYYCAREHHGYYGGYRYNRYFDYWGKGTQVTVTSASSVGPTVFPLIPCGSQSGEMVTLGCLATGFNPPSLTFSWTKEGSPLEDFIQYPAVQKGDVYTGVTQVQVRRQDWDARQNFQCAVTHAALNVTVPVTPPRTPPSTTKPTTILVTPTKKATPPQTPKTTVAETTMRLHSLSEQQILSLTDEVTLVCLVTSSVKKELKFEWLEMSGEKLKQLTEGVDFPAQQTKNDKKWRSMSLYTMTKEHWKSHPTKMFICKVQSENLTKQTSPDEDNVCDLRGTDDISEEDFSSLWSTAASFIFLFMFSLFYSIIISLVKMKKP